MQKLTFGRARERESAYFPTYSFAGPRHRALSTERDVLDAVSGLSMFTVGFVSLINSFSKYSVSSYYVPGTVLGSWDLAMNQMKSPPSWNLHSLARNKATTYK